MEWGRQDSFFQNRNFEWIAIFFHYVSAKSSQPYLIGTYMALTSPRSRLAIRLQVTITEKRRRRSCAVQCQTLRSRAASDCCAASELPPFSSHAHLSLSPNTSLLHPTPFSCPLLLLSSTPLPAFPSAAHLSFSTHPHPIPPLSSLPVLHSHPPISNSPSLPMYPPVPHHSSLISPISNFSHPPFSYCLLFAALVSSCLFRCISHFVFWTVSFSFWEVRAN